MFKCFCCGNDLGWIGDFNLDEVYPEEAVDGEEGVVGMYGCGKCELDYEITTYAKQQHMKVIFYEAGE